MVSLPVIRTKLHRPPILAAHLHRKQLLDRLNQGRQRPLTLVSAPAGYGKSTLVSCWLESCDFPSAWVSLDEADNDLRLFLSYFVSAILKIFPAACSGTVTILNSLPFAAAFGIDPNLQSRQPAHHHPGRSQTGSSILDRITGLMPFK